MSAAEPGRARGRPRAFDEKRFLDGAIALFSGAGYSGTGISDLTSATGLTVGSVYKAYGDKEGVFSRALDRYLALREAQIEQALRGMADARSLIEALLSLYVTLSLGPEGRLGCLVVSGIADLDQVGAAAAVLRAQLARRRVMLAALIAEGRRDGSIAASIDPETGAALLVCLLQGMRVVGRAGSFPEDGRGFVAHAMRMLAP